MKYEKMISEFFEKFMTSSKCSFDKFFGGFNKGELGALGFLSKNKEVNSKDLSEFLEVSTARVASILNSLESKNLIVRENDTDDKRKTLVNITDDGEKLTQEMKDEISKRIKYVVKEIGVDKFEEYLDLTMQIGEILKKYEEDEIC